MDKSTITIKISAANTHLATYTFNERPKFSYAAEESRWVQELVNELSELWG